MKGKDVGAALLLALCIPLIITFATLLPDTFADELRDILLLTPILLILSAIISLVWRD